MRSRPYLTLTPIGLLQIYGMAPSFGLDFLRNFDWKKNWKWVAVGCGLAFAVIVGVVVAVILTSDSDSGCGSSGKSIESYEEYQKYFLKENNYKRYLHGVAPLEFSEKLTEIALKCAQHYAEQGGIDFSCSAPEQTGATELSLECPFDKNMKPLSDAKIVSRQFYKPYYQYNFDTPEEIDSATRYFTAHVWKGAKKIGVGIHKSDGSTVFSVIYCPAVNVEGKFKENVLRKVK